MDRRGFVATDRKVKALMKRADKCIDETIRAEKRLAIITALENGRYGVAELIANEIGLTLEDFIAEMIKG